MDTHNQRLLSLDFFRGLTVAAMILVNNPGDWGHIYAPLEHSEWNGCTPTDLIFPFFLFIIGVSISHSMSFRKSNPASHRKTILKSCRRALILFSLGVFISLYPTIFTAPIEAFKQVRIPGVLQRIALVFLFSSICYLKMNDRTILKTIIGLLIFYWVLMMFVPVPHIGYANLEKETNLGAWIDRTLLTEKHLWSLSVTWDPEGLLGTIPAIGSGLIGVLAGNYLKRKEIIEAEKVAWLFTVGLFVTILGLIWDMEFPINKSLWTSSYVLYTGGLAIIGLALSYWLVDIKGYKGFTKPFVVYGVNAITVFFMSAIISKSLNLILIKPANAKSVGLKAWLYNTYLVPNFSPVNASLIHAIIFVLFWLVILWWMYNKKIFIKV